MKPKNIQMDGIASLASVNGVIILALPFFSGMLYDFFQPEMVFAKYGDWLFAEQRKGYAMPWYKKPFGGCLKCFHIWVCIVFIIASGDIDIKYLTHLGISYYILTRSYYGE